MGWMRSALAIFLIFCVGMMIPAPASSVRVCLLEQRIISLCPQVECCEDCEKNQNPPDPCCVEVEKLPDVAVPHAPLGLPPAIVTEIAIPVSPQPAAGVELKVFSASEPIRGPDSPTAYRAVLGIWRL